MAIVGGFYALLGRPRAITYCGRLIFWANICRDPAQCLCLSHRSFRGDDAYAYIYKCRRGKWTRGDGAVNWAARRSKR